MCARSATRDVGREGEQMAAEHLRTLGYEIVETNYRFGHGEVDIVALDGDILVFCEVKTRDNDAFGAPEYAITPRKQQQIRKIALGYLYEHQIRDRQCRFDVVAIRLRRGQPDLHYVKNAF